MFYPKNFPLQLEKPLIQLLLFIQTKTDESMTGKLLTQTIHLYLKSDKHIIFGRSVPSNWWLQFILYRHKNKFDPAFIKIIKPLLTKTKTRSLSGIVPLSLFTNGVGCPFHCVYCPNEPGMPKSYLSDEPAVMRALRHHFNPIEQTKSRLIMFCLSNHPLDKVEVIIKGGTFSFYPRQYRTRFVKQIYGSCNTDIERQITTGSTPKKSLKDLDFEQKYNETAKSRIVGINIETRPDFIDKSELRYLRKLGITHVELGVQALSDDIYSRIGRGHTVASVKNATQQLKDAGFKVGYHLMLNLPGTDAGTDMSLLKKAYENYDFKPDHLKLYPTAITPFTQLSKWFESGIYKPYSISEMTDVIIAFKKNVIPPWTRIGRLTRDITTGMMEHNPFPPNLREIIQKKMKEQHIICKCIRCREIKDSPIVGKIKLRILHYYANGGVEYFIEYIDKLEHSLGFLRLRIPSFITNNQIKPLFSILKNSAIVRELHVYGQSTAIGSISPEYIQHKNIGEKLLLEAERLTLKQRINKIAVIAGVGVRSYYRKFGYKLKETYMSKILSKKM